MTEPNVRPPHPTAAAVGWGRAHDCPMAGCAISEEPSGATVAVSPSAGLLEDDLPTSRHSQKPPSEIRESRKEMFDACGGVIGGDKTEKGGKGASLPAPTKPDAVAVDKNVEAVEAVAAAIVSQGKEGGTRSDAGPKTGSETKAARIGDENTDLIAQEIKGGKASKTGITCHCKGQDVIGHKKGQLGNKGHSNGHDADNDVHTLAASVDLLAYDEVGQVSPAATSVGGGGGGVDDFDDGASGASSSPNHGGAGSPASASAAPPSADNTIGGAARPDAVRPCPLGPGAHSVDGPPTTADGDGPLNGRLGGSEGRSSGDQEEETTDSMAVFEGRLPQPHRSLSLEADVVVASAQTVSTLVVAVHPDDVAEGMSRAVRRGGCTKRVFLNRSNRWCDELCGWTRRGRMWRAALAAVVVSAAVALVAVLMTDRNADTSAGVVLEGSFPPDDSGALPPASPTSIPGEEDAALEEEEDRWLAIGDPIHGLWDEPGVTISFDLEARAPVFGYGPSSNFTWSGISLALASNGTIFAIGEPGTSTVRVFERRPTSGEGAEEGGGEQEWIQLGRTIKVTEVCPGDDGDENIFGRRRRRRRERKLWRGLDEDTGLWHEVLKNTLNDQYENWFLPCVTGFGFEVDLSNDGTTLAVGGVGRLQERGMLRVYGWDDVKEDWAQRGSEVTGVDPGDGLGATVSLSGDGRSVAVSAPQSIHPSFAESLGKVPFVGQGYIRIYDWDDGRSEWVQRGEDIRGRSETDGMDAVSMTANGMTVAVGTFVGGYVDVLDWDDAERGWSPRGEDGPLVAPLGEQDFGSPLALSSEDGTVLAVSSDYIGDGHTTSDAHLVYVFKWTGKSWERHHRIAGMATKAGEGFSVALSADGSVLAAAFSNAVHVFELDGEHYVQEGTLEGGSFVDLSCDGKTLAIGRPYDNTYGLGLGRATVHGA